jgi:hypothetical protein
VCDREGYNCWPIFEKREEFLMKLRYLFVVNAVVLFILAAGFLLAPRTVLGLFGLSVGTTVNFNATLSFVAQLMGAALIVPGLLGWFAVGMTEVGARRSVAISLFIFAAIGFVLTLLGMLSNVMSVSGWILVLVFLVLALGYAYFLFMQQSDI